MGNHLFFRYRSYCYILCKCFFIVGWYTGHFGYFIRNVDGIGWCAGYYDRIWPGINKKKVWAKRDWKLSNFKKSMLLLGHSWLEKTMVIQCLRISFRWTENEKWNDIFYRHWSASRIRKGNQRSTPKKVVTDTSFQDCGGWLGIDVQQRTATDVRANQGNSRL